MPAFEIDARRQDHAHLGTRFAAHGDYAGQREAAKVDDVAANAARARYRIDFDLAAHRADRDAAHVELGFDIDAQRRFNLARAAPTALSCAQSMHCAAAIDGLAKTSNAPRKRRNFTSARLARSWLSCGKAAAALIAGLFPAFRPHVRDDNSPAVPWLNALATAAPGHDIHQAFIDWATPRLTDEACARSSRE